MITRSMVAAALMVFSIGPLQAKCDPAFESLIETSGAVDLDPFAPTPFERTLRISIRNNGADPCRLGVSATDRTLGARLLTNTQVPYDLIWDNLQIPNFDTPTPGRELSIAPGEAREFFVSLQIRRPLYAPPMPTEAVFTLRLHDLNNAAEVLVQTDARLAANIVAMAQINIAGTSSNFGSSYGIDTIDFGNLEQGKTQTVYVQLRGNSAMRMTMDSANGGEMRHETIRNAAGIAYTVSMLGTTFQPTALRTFNGLLSSGLFGTNIPMTLAIQEVKDRPAGRYSDVLTISIEPE